MILGLSAVIVILVMTRFTLMQGGWVAAAWKWSGALSFSCAMGLVFHWAVD